jgi:uncharacterized protein (TIGR03437 family)
MRHCSRRQLLIYKILTALVVAFCCSSALGATFTLGQVFPASFPADPAVADLNGDGKLDFILSGYTIMIFLGNGDGTFSLKQQFNEEGFNLQIGDLNGDAIPDFVIATGPGLQVFLGNGDGSFRTGQALAFPTAGANPALGDFNHDGKLDIAVASFQTNQVQIFLGNGDGTFSSPTFYATGIEPQFTLAVDLNHDGNVDLAVTSRGDGLTETSGVSILLGNSDGTFRARSFIKQPDYTLNTRSISNYLAAADFDGDGNLDLLVQGMLDPTTYILYGSGTGSFEPAAPVATNAEANTCLPGDFDGDGKPDIVCPGVGLTIVTNQGNRTFSPTTYFPGSFNSAAAGDFNQDGKLDLVVTGAVSSEPNGAFIFLNSRAVTQTVLSIAQPSPQYAQISHLVANVNTDVMSDNTGCFSTCPSGSVTWTDGNTLLATTPLSPGPDHSGTTSFDTYFSGGSHSISASYTGSELSSISFPVVLQVFPAQAALTVSTSPASPVYGAATTIAVNAIGASLSLAVPTGTVAIQDNGAPLATLPLNASGQTSLTSSSISGGNHTVQAKYAGDANYLSAVAMASFVVQPGPVQLALTCTPNPAASDEVLRCVARLSDPIATGSVSFSDGANALGSAPVSAGQAMLNFGPLAAGAHIVQAVYSGDTNFSAATSPSFGQSVTSTTKVIALAAADGHPSLAPQAIGAAYGTGFANGVTLANPGPLPNTLGGARVTITDASGAQKTAPLFFVSSSQINFLTPNLAAGPARLQINNAAGAIFTGPLDIQQVSPALFSANGDGKGVAAAYVVHVGADGIQSTQSIFECGKASGSCVPVPVDLGKPSDQNTLVLYGSGIRNASKVGVLFDTVTADVAFFGAQPQFAGLDQINVRIPSNLAGHGKTQIALTADGQSANQLLMQIK